MELIKSGLYIHIIKNFSGKLTEKDEYNIANLTDHELAVIYGEQLSKRILIRSGADLDEQGMVDEIYEPYAEVEIVGPKEYSGNIMDLAQEYRGEMKAMEYIDQTRILWRYEMPLGEIIIDFYDRLKSSTKGYATMNYEFKQYKASDLIKMDIYINGDIIEAFSMIVHRDKAYTIGADIVNKLKEHIPKHMFPIPLQAGI